MTFVLGVQRFTASLSGTVSVAQSPITIVVFNNQHTLPGIKGDILLLENRKAPSSVDQ